MDDNEGKGFTDQPKKKKELRRPKKPSFPTSTPNWTQGEVWRFPLFFLFYVDLLRHFQRPQLVQERLDHTLARVEVL